MLGRRVRQRERDCDAARAPRSEEARDERGPRVGEDRDALPFERGAPGEEGGDDGLRGREETAVRRPPECVDDGGPPRVRAEPLEEAQRSNVSFAMMRRWIWLVPS